MLQAQGLRVKSMELFGTDSQVLDQLKDASDERGRNIGHVIKELQHSSQKEKKKL